MKKSEMYRMAQLAVLNAEFLDDRIKLDIIHELVGQEDLKRFVEQKNEGDVDNG